MRCFIAIELPRTLREDLVRHRSPIAKARWVTVDTMHLTLRFLGNLELERAEHVMSALAALGAPRFELRLSDPGTFPPLGGRRPPRVLWMGIADSPALIRLEREVTEILSGEGVPKETRPYHPHITLARIKHANEGEVEAAVEAQRRSSSDPEDRSDVFPVEEIVFFESELSSDGATHVARRRIPLLGSDFRAADQDDKTPAR